MSDLVHVGALAFVGPSHAAQLSDFQYVEVVSISDNGVEGKVTGPDDNDASTFEVPKDTIELRVVADAERRLWPGSFIAHPIAFVQTSQGGVDEWSYGVVSGYTASGITDILHIVSSEGPIRLPLTEEQPVIKVDPLNYALQPGRGVNAVALSPQELLRHQDSILAACRRRRSGRVPPAVMTNLSTPFAPDDTVPLVKPATLQLVHVRRQHIVEFQTVSRTNRPDDLYADNIPENDDSPPLETTVEPTSTRSRKRRIVRQMVVQPRAYDSTDEAQSRSSSEQEDVQEVQHMNTSLSKRRRVRRDSDTSDESSSDRHVRVQKGIVFHPSPTDRRIHAAIINRRHTGTIPQTLLQSIQQSTHVKFVASPAVLRGLYSFAFELGISVMHCKRALWTDEAAMSEKSVNLWDFSSKNGYQTPPKVSSYVDLISALATLHKFAQYFYNSATADFISAAKDFVIGYADHARPEPSMARLLAFWINGKFSLFRSKVLSEGLHEATKVSAQFCRSDDKLSALRDSSQSWKPASSSRFRAPDNDRNSRQHRTSTTSRIPSEEYSQLPLGDDGRKLCLKYLSKSGCQYSKCSNGHFRPDTLPDGPKKIILDRWGVLGTQFADL